MANTKHTGTGHRRRRSVFFAPLIFLAVCAALLFGISVFFRVSQIDVIGTEVCSPDQIIADSEIQMGDNLFLINRFAAVSRIKAKQPYIDEVSVSRSVPNRIVIEVSESVGLAYLVDDSGFPWIIDQKCKALDRSDWETVSSLIKVTGITPSAPEKGETITEEDSTDQRVEYLAELLQLLRQRDMISDISEINLDNPANPTLRFLDRFTVCLGSRSDTDYKISKFLSAVSQLDAAASGILDLSIDGSVHFISD